MSDRSRDWNPAAEFHSESIGVTVCSLHVVDITKNGDCHVCDAISANERAEAAEAEIKRLQDEIERLKGYAVHQKRCAKWWYHQIEAPHGQLRDGVACSCGLEADRPQCRTCKHYEPIGPSIGLCNGKWGNAAIPPVFGCEQHVEKSCGLAPETGAT